MLWALITSQAVITHRCQWLCEANTFERLLFAGTTDVQATVTQPLSELKVQEMIAHCSVAGFGDLKEGATVVDASVRRAWESFFDLDFDYSWQRSDFPQDYVVGLHPMVRNQMFWKLSTSVDPGF